MMGLANFWRFGDATPSSTTTTTSGQGSYSFNFDAEGQDEPVAGALIGLSPGLLGAPKLIPKRLPLLLLLHPLPPTTASARPLGALFQLEMLVIN